jgi:hypothetical protein
LDLDSFVPTVLLVKAVYFVMVLVGIFSLTSTWRAVTVMSSVRLVWGYRLLGLASIGALLAVHASTVYQFGRTEREVQRNMFAANQQLPASPQAGVRTDRIRLERRDWIYESTMTELQASQINKEKFGVLVRPLLSSTICIEAWHRRLLAMHLRIRHVIFDRSGEIIADESFGPETCPQPS